MAHMPATNPIDWNYSIWLLAISMAVGGGFINWIAYVKSTENHVFSIFELMGELFTSGIIGVGVFMVAQTLGQDIGVSAALAGIGGHMATRLLFLVERLITGKLGGGNRHGNGE
jgi:hypothetical protein